MGKIIQQETTHFSHPHPLKLIPYQQTLNLTSSCPACNLNPSGSIYSCTPCNFFLHQKCFEMPTKITHPFHKDHTFTLLPRPAYAEGLFSCDACGQPGKGVSYHCKPCGVDLHVPCASMPLSVTRACHMHELRLTFGLPKSDTNFYCDVCMGPGGSRHWLYRCGPCGFDAHLNCALGFEAAVGSSRSAPPQQTQGFGPRFENNAAIGVPAGDPLRVPSYVPNREAVLQMINHNNATTAQAMLASGGGDGGYRVLRQQQLMQMISNYRNGGGAGGAGILARLNGMGGGGAGGQYLLQGLMGGGGGGGVPGLSGLGGGGSSQDILQALMSGGSGGGGLDLQSLLGGGNGIGYLGGALGGFGF
ncbi:hypothetical protein CASFOL_033833 [Castilleja foliolosa]|uniref:DC1 domain-containing protein n=1 Tax=Castilleja foliolosa TaxID=1961234 RepID=A0ABD3BYN1_9LAMI